MQGLAAIGVLTLTFLGVGSVAGFIWLVWTVAWHCHELRDLDKRYWDLRKRLIPLDVAETMRQKAGGDDAEAK